MSAKENFFNLDALDQGISRELAEGMTTLLQDGIQKVFGGRTDLEQVRAVCLR